MIAYTSDFIPRMVYKYKYSPDDSLTGYIDASLSLFNTSHYHDDMGADPNYRKPPTCQYRGYRNDPDDLTEPYGLSPQYWHVFAARLAFVVIFEVIISVILGLNLILFILAYCLCFNWIDAVYNSRCSNGSRLIL